MRRRRGPIPLRPLLGALALGALALPLAMVLVLGLALRGEVSAGPINRFVIAMRHAQEAVAIDGSGALSAKPSFRAPAWLGLVVLDAEGRALYSSIPGIAAGTGLGAGSAAGRALEAAIAAGAAAGECFFSEKIEVEGRVRGSWYAIVPATDFRKEVNAWQPLINAAILASLALGAFSAGVFVAAKLGRDVQRLVGAAGRIASGDLETAVALGGVREMVDLAAAMDRMRLALKEDYARRARFLASISHDLRTPLTSIGGYLEAVEDGLAAEPATLARYVAIMRDRTRVLEGRIAGLIEFARMETGEWTMRFERLELRPFLEALAREFREDAELLGRRLEHEIDALGDLVVSADRSLLRRALENILSNALRYGPPGSPVVLSAARSGGALELTIEDQGPGLRPDEAEKVFEPFYRGTKGREGEGLGLGLYIARSVIRGHGWEIVAGARTSGEGGAQGGGAMFIISIPLHNGGILQ